MSPAAPSTADLFDRTEPAPSAVPLAERLRPQRLEDFVGQRQLLGPGMPLARAFVERRLHSMILWGPPGVGKTTLARLLAQAVDAQFLVLSAVLAGVKDIRDAVAAAEAARRQGRATIVFVDEVHRFNKAQQDAFLPHVESGLFTFVGATTENPAFELNAALLSRAVVYVLEPLGADDLRALAARAGQLLAIALDEPALQALLEYADGDARRLLNAMEILAQSPIEPGVSAQFGDKSGIEPRRLGLSALAQALGRRMRRFDADGDAFYDSISALHKSVRGSDPDAALYWFARMLDGGCDPRYLARRLLRMASEDIGLADPRALALTLDAADTYERLGSPEGELALAQALVYLAVAPKSNAVYRAYQDARALVESTGSLPVPAHLRNAPTALARRLGHGQGYRYDHDEEGAHAAGQSHWPQQLAPRRLYEPSERGLEQRIAERLRQWRAVDDEAAAGD
jgi:putative ATPase